jgi:spermidine/putrescine transport system substrate-binding protein
MAFDDIWEKGVNRRDFLKAGAALGLGGTAAWIAAACGSSSAANVSTTPTPINYAKAEIDGDLNLFNWSQYMSPDVITAFANKYGIKVNTPYFDNMEDMLTKINAGTSYDITFPTMDYAQQMIRAGLAQPIDHTQLTNWAEVPAYFQDPWYDPKALYTAPYAIWTTGIMYRTDQVQGMTGSWSDFWNLADKYGDKMFLLYDFQETLGMSLLRDGKDVNSKNRSDLDTAVNNVLQIKSKLRGFETDDITNTVNGTAFIHHAWSGDVYQVINQVSDPTTIKYQTCKEGVPTGNDTMMVLKNAQHPGTALKFIDWMLDPKNATANVDYFGYPQVTNTGISHFNSTIGTQYPFLSVSLDQAIHGLREIVPTGQNLQLWLTEWRKLVYG